MPHAALTPAAPTDQAALRPPPPTVAEPRGAPWRVAIAEARSAHRVTRVVPRSTRRTVRAPAADGQTRAAHTNASASSPARPLVPITRCTGGSLLESELAARAPGLRAPAIRPSRGALTSVPVAPFKPSRIDPLNREPGAIPDPDQYIASTNPLISADPRDAPHCTRGASAAGKKSLPHLNANER